MSEEQIPDGYLKDAKGRLVPIATVKPIDLERDHMVRKIINSSKFLSYQLQQLKASVFGDIEAFIDLSIEQYGAKKAGGSKGNLTLYSFDGKYKIQRANQDFITFDERLQAAKILIDECLQEWSKDSHPGLVMMVNDAFRADAQGELRTARVLALRRHEINDDRWKRAMDAIGDALQVCGSKTYIRVYERVGMTDEYKQIALDIAGV